MAIPIYATVLSQINTYIVANGNNEITANVLNPILKLMLDFSNNNIGDLDTLTTDEKNSIVEAINSLKQNFDDLVNNGVQLYTGIDDPNVTPPPTYKYADFYMQLDIDSLPVKLWQWNGFVWTDASQEPATESDNVINNSDVDGVTVTDALNTLNTNKANDSNVVHKVGDTFVYATDFDDVLSQDPNTQTIEKRGLKPEDSRLNPLLTPIYSWGDSLTLGAGYNPYPNQLNGLSRFDVTNKGVGGNTSTQIKDRFLLEPANFSKSVIIWSGRNNYLDPTTVKSDIATMISNLGHDRYLVVGIINGNYATEYINQSGWTAINNLNNDLKTLYGRRFVDIRPYLVSLHNQTAQDLIDFANDIPPTSIRVDNLHLSSAGYTKVAEFLNRRLGVLFGSDGYLQSKDIPYYQNIYGISNQNSIVQAADFRIGGNGIANRFFTRELTASDFSARHQILQNDNSVNRFSTGLTDVETGSGSTGSNYVLVSYDDTGNVIGNPFTVFRNTGNIVLKSGVLNAVDAGYKFDVLGTARITNATIGNANITDTSVSGIPLIVGGGTSTGWVFANAGATTNRAHLRGYFSSTLTTNIDPSTSGFSYFNANRYGFGTSTDDGVNRVQISGNASGTLAASSSNHFTRKGEVDTALGLKADLASPIFTGTPTAPTAAAGTNTTQVATTAFVQATLPTSGAYTPTYTSGTNVTSTTNSSATYTRVGNTITARVSFSCIFTAPNTDTTITFTLPVARATTALLNLGTGTGFTNVGGANSLQMLYSQSSATTTAAVKMYPTNGTQLTGTIVLMYNTTD